MIRREANKDALRRTYASHQFGRLIPLAGDDWKIGNHLSHLNTETLEIILEIAWDDWNFGSGDPRVLKLFEQIEEFVKIRKRNRR